MKVSLNWIRLMNANYGCSNSTELGDVDELINKIGAQLGAVEEVINLGERYDGVVVVKVISCEKHPNADKLKVCTVDDGRVVKNVKRNKEGLVEVICGAPNVTAGQLVAWIPPGVIVPSTFDKDPMVLEARELRGIVSNGMLASPKELALGDSHEGLLIIEEEVKPGTAFAQLYQLDDYIIDIENKMFTHRPDCFGILGVARELAGIYNKPFKSPQWYQQAASLAEDGRKNVLSLSVKNDKPKLVPRFCVVAIKDVKVAPSPIWLQSFLLRSGVRPINNIVDITNWFMMATAQPLHAYDYDKVKTGVLGARLSKKGEKLKLLNGRDLTLDDGDVVITDGQRPIGLGGIMGGAETEVDETTKNIILECASFDMNQTRKTAMRYGLYTDASTRFTKNQSPRQNRAVIVKTAHDMIQLVGGRVASQLIDDKHQITSNPTVKTDAHLINYRLGLALSPLQIKKLLQNVEFSVSTAGDKLEVIAPFWRTDIEIAEDIVEEVGRLYGYDKLPQHLPTRPIEPVSMNLLLGFKNKLRQILSEYGANEVLTYSFVHGNLLKISGQDSAAAYKLNNALSPSLQYYRFSLAPSLLDKVHANIKVGYDKFALFEIGKGHTKENVDKQGLPTEFELLCLIYSASSKSNPAGAAYYQAKKYLDELAAKLGIELKYSLISEMPQAAIAQPYDLQRSAMVSLAPSGMYLGIIGEFKPSVRQSLKLPEHSAGFEIDITALSESSPLVKAYQPLPRFPQTYQDLCLRTDAALSYAELTGFLVGLLEKSSDTEGYIYSIDPLDIYQRPNDNKHKQTTWRISLSHPNKTLKTEEVNELMDLMAKAASKQINAERI